MKALVKQALTSLPLARSLLGQRLNYSDGSVLENRLGYQVLRMLSGRLFMSLRRMGQRQPADKAFKYYLDQMLREGIVIFPDFLPSETYTQIVKEVEHAETKMEFRPFRQHKSSKPVKLVEAATEVRSDDRDFYYINTFLTKDALIRGIAARIMGVPITGDPEVRIVEHKVRAEAEIDNDLETILHADLHLPTVKAWYYLNRITKENGAFVYAKGSHQVTFTRIGHEYRKSVYAAALRKGSHIPPSLLETRGDQRRIAISDSDIRAMNIRETSIVGEPNTLVIANTMGFHRRGEFEPGQVRKTVFLDFRRFNKGWS